MHCYVIEKMRDVLLCHVMLCDVLLSDILLCAVLFCDIAVRCIHSFEVFPIFL